MSIATGITLTVYVDHDYRYNIEVSDEMALVYEEDGREQDLRIGFGSLNEMEAVANAMLRAVKLAKEVG